MLWENWFQSVRHCNAKSLTPRRKSEHELDGGGIAGPDVPGSGCAHGACLMSRARAWRFKCSYATCVAGTRCSSVLDSTVGSN
jgi:hypothetical protein